MVRRVKLEDIAKKVGVSKMSVSLALRDDPSIGEETKLVIRRVAEEMGYVPNYLAKGLALGKTYMLAAIVGGGFHDDYHNRFLRAAIEHAISRGYTLTVGMTGGLHNEREMYQKFKELMVEGFLCFHADDCTIYENMLSQNIPFILYTKYFPHLPCDAVVCDDVLGGGMLTDHLLDLGHERIAFVYDSILWNSSEVLGRIAGYRLAMERRGLAFQPDWVVPQPYKCDPNDDQPLYKLLNGPERPTALFVCNDVTAAHLYIWLKQIGFRIPQDISVCGYEGVYLGEILDPPLTTVSSPIEQMGREACKLLIDKIETVKGRHEPAIISLEPALTVRKSTVRR